MDPRRWDEVQRLFELSQDVPEGERRAWLEARCASDPELLEEVWDLLQQDLPSGFGHSPLERPEGEPAEGRVLGGFRLIRVLGQGGMGTVYLAEQENVGRLVAVKVLPPFGANERARERFRREAKVVAGLDHPHVVPLLVADETDHLAWYAMRFVGGWDLNQELEHQRQARSGRGTPELMLPPFGAPDHVAAVAERTADLADAVQHAHSRGVVHRDVKPHNVLIDPQGRFHLTDFGLARDESQGTIHASGDLLGTPHYMSPEQARALEDPVDHRTDVYSLGVVLYECLTLKRPFEGRTSQEVLANITRREPPSLRVANPAVPRDLAVIVEKAMGKRPSWRYDSAQALADDLRRFLRGEPVLARRPGFVERSARWVQRHRTAVTVAGMLVAGLVAGDMWSTRRQVRAGFRADEALFEEALAIEDWSGTPRPELRRARDRAEALAGAPLPSGLGERVGAFRARLEADRARRTDEIGEIYRRGLGGPEPTVEDKRREAQDSLLRQGLRLAQEALALHPDDPTLRGWALEQASWPVLDLAIHPECRDVEGWEAATATLFPIDPYYGEWEPFLELGTLPLEAVPVPPGYYVIRVDVPGVARAELVRRLVPGPEPIEETVWLRRTEDVLPGMREIPAGPLVLNRVDSLGCLPGGPSVELEAFHVAEACVSNREYVEFLEATDTPAPQRWRELGYPDGDTWTELLQGHEAVWPDLPVVGMTWYEANACAEWLGGRLPTHHECERYQRGPDGLRRPGPAPGPAWGNGAVVGRPSEPSIRDARTSERWYATYLEHTRPVREPGFRQAPEGLFHTFGNVWEYTISGVVETQREVLVVLPYKVLVLGCDWAATTQDLSTHFHWGVDEAYDRFDVGFRCVRR